MTLLSRLRSFLAALVTGRRLEREMDEEWQFHVEARADALAAEGISRDQAIRRARAEFGDTLRWREGSRDARGVRWLYDLFGDVQYGVRQLRRAPVFAVTAIGTLALGIGANTLAFSILNGVLVRDLPYPDPERIVMVWFAPPEVPDATVGATLQNYFAVRDRSESFSWVGSLSEIAGSIATRPDDAAGGEPVAGQRIHATLPPVLGVQPALGAWFTEADDPPTAPRKIMLSHELWQERFGGDVDVVGRTIRMDGGDATVVGVMPAGFEFMFPAQFWTPSRWSPATMNSPSRMIRVAGRLKDDITLQQAQAEMDVLAASLSTESPRTNEGWRIRLEPIYSFYTNGVREPLLLLQGVVVIVLLIACANVAGLLLSRASTRERELAVRSALGSSRGRIVRQLVTESVLLSGLGGICGVLLAVAGLRLFLAQNPASWLPRADGIVLDDRVMVFTVVMTAASVLLFGVLPSWKLSRPGVVDALKGSRVIGHGVTHQRLRGVLVSGQVALALVLLMAAGLFLNSLVRLNLNRPGIDPTNLVTFRVRLPFEEFSTPTGTDAGGFFTLNFSPRIAALFEEIRVRLAAVPGVQSAAGSLAGPTASGNRMAVRAPGEASPAGADVTAGWFPVTPEYFKTLGVRLRAGREFTPQDSSGGAPVAIVNETLAKALWPNANPIGREIAIDFVNDTPRQVIGVVEDVRESSRQTTFAPHMFVPDAQLPLPSRGWFRATRVTMTYAVRTAGDPMTMMPSLRAAVAEIYRAQPIYGVRTMEQILGEDVVPWRQYLMLLGVFAVIAAMLALVGVYGLVAYGVGQRMREIGIRRALGAGARDVLQLVMRQGLWLTTIGVAAGVLASLALTRLIAGLLWNVSPTDPLTFVLVASALVVSALLACLVPARRALTVDPMTVLRTE